MFNYKDIQWVRNVKREGGKQKAYLEDNTKDEFILQWSSRYINANEALKPKVGDLILVFQNINEFNGIQLTHLVTPIDENFEDCSKFNSEFPWGRKVSVIARVENGKNPKPFDLNFASVSRTHSFPIDKISSNEKLSKKEIQLKIWNTFNSFFKEDLEKIYSKILDINMPKSISSAIEGTENFEIRTHLLRERSAALVAEKKRLASEKGALICDCCLFDFSKTYPDIGNGFIECHHIIPIHKGERVSNIDELALVCSNCHRMLHRKNKNNDYYTVKELSEIIINQ